MKNLQVAMVNTELTRGGAAKIAAGLTAGFNRSPLPISAALYHCENNLSESEFIGLKKPLSRQLNAGLARMGGSFAVADGGVASRIVSAIALADVLHIHNVHGYYLNFEKLLRAWRHKPIVWTWHDMWPVTGRCGFSFDCDGWRRGCPGCPHKEYYPAAWLDRASQEFTRKSKLYALMDNLTIVSPSAWLADIAVQRGFDTSRVFTIPNPVDTAAYKLMDKSAARNKLGLGTSQFVVLFIASDCNDTRKGYLDFARMCSSRPWLGIAVGKPPLQPAKHLHHAGIVMEQELINCYYAAADAMVIPTYADNYPNTVIESLVSGTPVIGYDEGGVASQLDMPGCAVVNKGDWVAAQQQLQIAFSGGGKSGELAGALSERARQRWAYEKVLASYVTVYRGSMAQAQ